MGPNYLGPEGLGHVKSGASWALLPTITKRRPQGAIDWGFCFGKETITSLIDGQKRAHMGKYQRWNCDRTILTWRQPTAGGGKGGGKWQWKYCREPGKASCRLWGIASKCGFLSALYGIYDEDICGLKFCLGKVQSFFNSPCWLFLQPMLDKCSSKTQLQIKHLLQKWNTYGRTHISCWMNEVVILSSTFWVTRKNNISLIYWQVTLTRLCLEDEPGVFGPDVGIYITMYCTWYTSNQPGICPAKQKLKKKLKYSLLTSSFRKHEGQNTILHTILPVIVNVVCNIFPDCVEGSAESQKHQIYQWIRAKQRATTLVIHQQASGPKWSASESEWHEMCCAVLWAWDHVTANNGRWWLTTDWHCREGIFA